MSDGGSVQVNPASLMNYGKELLEASVGPLGEIGGPIGGVVEGTMKAFTQSPPGTGPFREGVTAMQLVKRNLTEFQAFLGEVRAGLTAIQSAATAMAVAYASTDDESAGTLNAVDFAFADGGQTPKGFPSKGVSTLSAQQQAANEAAGGNTMAATAANDPSAVQYATGGHPLPDGTGYAYTFADGSMLVVSTQTNRGMFIGSTTTTRTVYDGKNAQPAQVITEDTGTGYDGGTTDTRTVKSRNTDGSYTSGSTAVAHNTDGSVTVTTTSADAQGKPLTVHSKPAAPAPSPNDKGEIEKIEDRFHTQGDPKNFKYGRT